jgi:DNA segregation ATPase FtsK/SpoIIIE-like protein
MDETWQRYELLDAQKKSNVRQLDDHTLLPRVDVVIDEFADLPAEKASKSVLNELLKQIGAMSRSAGIHLAPAT